MPSLLAQDVGLRHAMQTGKTKEGLKGFGFRMTNMSPNRGFRVWGSGFCV